MTTDKPQQIEWIPLFFILGACYIVTLVVFAPKLSDVVSQGVMGIAMTFAGTAGGAYAPKLLQRFAERRSADAADPTQPAQG